MRRMAVLLVAVSVLLCDPGILAAQELTLSGAISMKEAVEEIGLRFVQSRSGVLLHYNFDGSGELQKQIEAGAPVDVFVAAADRQMDELERKGLILPGSRRTFAHNALSAIVPADTRLTITRAADLLQPQAQRIAIGNPKTVPAGQYAEESLRTLGLWDALRPKLVFGENVRQVLEYAARGEVEAGFVYGTDLAGRSCVVREAFRPPQNSYRSEGQKTLARLGFQPPTERR